MTCGCTLAHLCPEAEEIRAHFGSLSVEADGLPALQEAMRDLIAHRRAAGIGLPAALSPAQVEQRREATRTRLAGRAGMPLEATTLTGKGRLGSSLADCAEDGE